MNGIFLRLLAVALITAMSATVHGLARTLPVGQIMFWRSLIALIPILAYLGWRGQLWHGLATKHPFNHLVRSAFGCLSMLFSFLSLAYLPVANASALAYLAPLMTLPMAAGVLGERIRPVVKVASGLGFIGVVAMLWGTFQFSGLGRAALIGVAAGLGYAATMGFVRVHIKRMTETETPAAIAFYFALVCTAVGALSAVLGWAPVDQGTLMLLILSGLLGGAAHIASVEAVARAPVSTLAPFEYTGMIWALGFDLWLFGTVPDLLTGLGLVTIVAAAMVVMRDEIRPSAVRPESR